MKIIILSDVHGNILRCQDVASKNPDVSVVQLGDLGVGFLPPHVFRELPANFHFFPGNHDKRSEALTMPSCLGSFGSFFNDNIFIVSGANSKDKELRTEGINWWPDEELTYEQGQRCIDEWAGSKAQVIVSHDAPQHLVEGFFLIYDRSRTRQILDSMIRVRRPLLVVFGHHHRPFSKNVLGVEYFGMKIDQAITLDISENNVKLIP